MSNRIASCLYVEPLHRDIFLTLENDGSSIIRVAGPDDFMYLQHCLYETSRKMSKWREKWNEKEFQETLTRHFSHAVQQFLQTVRNVLFYVIDNRLEMTVEIASIDKNKFNKLIRKCKKAVRYATYKPLLRSVAGRRIKEHVSWKLENISKYYVGSIAATDTFSCSPKFMFSNMAVRMYQLDVNVWKGHIFKVCKPGGNTKRNHSW